MPGESIAVYVNNIITFTVFIIVLAFIFTLLILWSYFLTGRNLKKEDIEDKEAGSKPGPVSSPIIKNYRKDPYLRKNAFILVTVFIIIISFIFLIFAVFNYTMNPSINLNLYLIIGVLFYLILMVIYLIKSKIIS
jgi:NADH:ubiquinone oxidoreductase subunit 3 (subunit A)